VQEDLEESDDAGVVDLDAGIADCADSDWKGAKIGANRHLISVESGR
jgi:hypothetical protein